jgi:hypothetical protein
MTKGITRLRLLRQGVIAYTQHLNLYLKRNPLANLGNIGIPPRAIKAGLQ